VCFDSQPLTVVHIHPNNFARPIAFGKYVIPPFMEFTFLRKDRISSRKSAVTFPHPLDRRNVFRNDDFPKVAQACVEDVSAAACL
jgi:hypothetical protein